MKKVYILYISYDNSAETMLIIGVYGSAKKAARALARTLKEEKPEIFHDQPVRYYFPDGDDRPFTYEISTYDIE
jgi:hypothetical protein